MDARDELIIELLARRDAVDALLGDFIGHPRYSRMSYADAAERATAFNIYEDALDVGFGPEIEQRILDFEEAHDAAITARSRQLYSEALLTRPYLRNERGTTHE